VKIPAVAKKSGFSVAVVGAGPSGLTIAGELIKMGHKVTLFEALHKAGGVLVYGIPEFRLPKKIVSAEVNYIERLGVELRCDAIIGRLETVDELLKKGFNAVYIATGAGAPMFMKIPGENLNFVYSANEFLTRVNLMEAYRFPESDTPVIVGKRVVVIGGGNTAMDAARCALRLGPEKVTLIYRRSSEEMPARKAEIHHAEEEGIEFMMLAAPVEYRGDEKGNVKVARCVRMKLGEADQSGRRRPVVIPGSEFEIEVDSVIVAIGTQANPIIADTTQGLKVNYKGYIEVDSEGRTFKPGVFAGGDIVSGSATVIEAMRAGRVAARAIDNYLAGLKK
ncbi:MAG: FAD-dependent oxidoreductase, partial [Candidatus Omnitrophica bacterium]|nr:FAD-dependent oxidoreductase [Candidatus Omnitrophota bacterium]